MAVYKIFPTADATIYSRFPVKNTGLDEVLEVSAKNNSTLVDYSVDIDPAGPISNDDLRRALVLFSDEDINTIKSYSTGSWKAGLKLYLANAENLSTTYSLEIRQVSSSWQMGTGKYNDFPDTVNGVSWFSPTAYVTASNTWVNASYFLTPGGGNWTGSFATQSYTYKDAKDINVDVTPIVNSWFNGSQNSGFIVKHPTAVENYSASFVALSFFSVDTHTIYPPTLEMKWDDSTYTTGSLSVLNNNNFILSLDNNVGTYKSDTTKYRFRVNARDKYPVRTFTTSSIYNVNKALPIASYWSLYDLKAEETIVEFDTTFTKISCDATSSYFDLYMMGLEPERYYKILIKTVLPTGESIDVDNDYIFKIIR
jgi:hypothetical protein